MTKLRAPDSIEDAVTQAKALLGNGAIAVALSAKGLRCSESLVDKWCDQDAPQKPSLEQALALELLLIKAGYQPIFADLFTRLAAPPDGQASNDTDPLRAAMHTVTAATDLMTGVDRSLIDGRVDRAELLRIDQLTCGLARQIARVRRIVRAASERPKARK